jgi:hypothetical protein
MMGGPFILGQCQGGSETHVAAVWQGRGWVRSRLGSQCRQLSTPVRENPGARPSLTL